MTRSGAGHGEKRSRYEDAALAALLSEQTIAQAAARAGISESTLLRWLAEPTFKARYREARRQVVEHAITGLQQSAGEAVEALRRNLTSGVPAAEIAAAKAIIDHAIKGVELVDLAERVEALEQAAAATPGREKGSSR
jgi:DNA-binding MurR/RpiR family transcriptional regulator